MVALVFPSIVYISNVSEKLSVYFRNSDIRFYLVVPNFGEILKLRSL